MEDLHGERDEEGQTAEEREHDQGPRLHRVGTVTVFVADPDHYSRPVPLRRMVKNLRSSSEDLHRQQLTGRFDVEALDTVPIASAPLRARIKIAGEVARIRVVPRAGSPSLEVTVDDGSGRALVVFTGRRRIPGIDPGRGIVLDGTAREERHRLLLMNPSYTLLP